MARRKTKSPESNSTRDHRQSSDRHRSSHSLNRNFSSRSRSPRRRSRSPPRGRNGSSYKDRGSPAPSGRNLRFDTREHRAKDYYRNPLQSRTVSRSPSPYYGRDYSQSSSRRENCRSPCVERHYNRSPSPRDNDRTVHDERDYARSRSRRSGGNRQRPRSRSQSYRLKSEAEFFQTSWPKDKADMVRYEEYKAEFICKQKKAYFEAHKEDEGLKEKYHPTYLLAAIERRNVTAQNVATKFLLELQSGHLDLGPGVNLSTTNKSGRTCEQTAPKTMKKKNDLSTAPKAHPVSSDPRRIEVDIQQAQALVRKLDFEKGIKDNILCGSDDDKLNREEQYGGSTGPVISQDTTFGKSLEGDKLLDTLITYLWRIHGADYYGMIESNEAKGLRHVRAEVKDSDMGSNGSEWEKNLDLHWQKRLTSQDPLETFEIRTAKDKIEAAAAVDATSKLHIFKDLYYQNYMKDADAPITSPVKQQFMQETQYRKRSTQGSPHSPISSRPNVDKGRLNSILQNLPVILD